MRIVIWTDSFSPDIGGLEIFCLRLMEAWQSRGHECLIVANCDPESAIRREQIQGVRVHRFAFHHSLNRADLAAFRRMTEACGHVIAAFAPDLIHLNVCSKGLLPFALLQRQLRRPVVMTLHDRHLYRNVNALTREVLDYCDEIVAVSDFIRADVQAHWHGLEGKLHVIPNALPAPGVSPNPLPSNPRLLALGRLIPEKGMDLAIKAFALLADEFPAVTLTIAGDGIARALLEKLAAALDLTTRVKFLGRCEPGHIYEIINQHSIVIVPSRWEEPFGLVALEAAQMGRPVCAARCGGLPEIVVDGKTGFLFKPEDPDDLARVLKTLLISKAWVAKMGECARAHAGQRFVYETFLDRYENLYRRVTGDDLLIRSAAPPSPSPDGRESSPIRESAPVFLDADASHP